MNPDLDDSTLMLRLQAGENSAFNQIMTRWQTPLLRFIYRYSGNADEAQDLAQETFVRVYQNRNTYRSKTQFASWLFTIASNLCRNHARWKRRHPTVSINEGSDLQDTTSSYPSPERNPHDSAAYNDLAAKVRDAIQSLPHDLKTVILLFEYEELSHSEIAGVLGCTAKAVETRLYRARKLLQEKLRPFADP